MIDRTDETCFDVISWLPDESWRRVLAASNRNGDRTTVLYEKRT